MYLSSIKKHAIGGRYSILDRTFQGQKHGCKDFGLQATPPATTRQVASSYDTTRWRSLSSDPSIFITPWRPIAFAPSLAFVSSTNSLSPPQLNEKPGLTGQAAMLCVHFASRWFVPLINPAKSSQIKIIELPNKKCCDFICNKKLRTRRI